MPRRTSTPAPADRPAFTYSPGDRHTYRWDGTADHATVWRHGYRVDADGKHLTFTRTTDTVPMAGTARTATAFMDAMDRWRATVNVGAGS